MGERRNEDERIRELIDGGVEIAGAAAGSAIGFFAGGPGSVAALGAANAIVGHALKRVAADVADRWLSREKERVGGVLALAADTIRRRLTAGEQLRTDGFFDHKASGRSDAEEVVESVLIKSQRGVRRAKAPFHGTPDG